MPCSAYVSYQIGESADSKSLSGRFGKTEPIPSVKRQPAAKHTSTSFVLVDPSSTASKGGGKDARSSIRKHASKACAAQRLATIAEKKKSLNLLSKRERQRQLSAERLEAALQDHAKRFGLVKEEEEEDGDVQGTKLGSCHADEELREFERRTSDSSDTLSNATLVSTNDSIVRKKCSIPWLLAAPQSPEESQNCSTPHTAFSCSPDHAVIPWQPSLEISKVPPNIKDPVRYSNFDFTVDDRVEYLMDFMQHSIFELMSLRLPTKADKQLGKPNLWRTIMPQLLLNSEPLYWATALGAGTLDSLRLQQVPIADSGNLKYRDRAICSVNKRLRAPETELMLDCGLVSAIASLGTWERQCGSREIWRAHCMGAETLLQKLRASNKDQMVAQMIASCQDEVSELGTDIRSPGFRRTSKQVDLDPDLVSSLCACHHIQSIQPYEQRLELLESTAAEILRHTTIGTMSKVIRFPNRINLEMHVLIQAAGVSMIKFLAGQDAITNVDQIDFSETCRETVDLAKSVSSVRTYDELLLWAVFTIHSLNDNAELEVLQVISQLARRLQISYWPSLEDLLRSFVYLESANAAYRSLWAMILPEPG